MTVIEKILADSDTGDSLLTDADVYHLVATVAAGLLTDTRNIGPGDAALTAIRTVQAIVMKLNQPAPGTE